MSQQYAARSDPQPRPDTTVLPTVDVVMPTHLPGDELDTCLGHLLRLEPPPHAIRIAVDGGDTAVVLRVHDTADHLVVLEVRSGPAAARNRAAAGSQADVLLFIDADVAVPPDLVSRVAHIFAADEELDAMIGSYDDQPTAPGVLSQYKNLQHHFTHQHASSRAETFWGACGAMRRETFERLGGFDEQRYDQPSVEDIELGYRLHAAGGRIVLDPSVQVTHLKTWRAGDLLRTELFRRAVPWSRLMLERGKIQGDLGVDLTGRARVSAAWLLAVCLVAAPVSRRARQVVLPATSALLWLDRGLIRFLGRHGSGSFVIRSMAWHWFAHLYSGFGFAWALARHRWALARHRLDRRKRARPGTLDG